MRRDISAVKGEKISPEGVLKQELAKILPEGFTTKFWVSSCFLTHYDHRPRETELHVDIRGNVFSKKGKHTSDCIFLEVLVHTFHHSSSSPIEASKISMSKLISILGFGNWWEKEVVSKYFGVVLSRLKNLIRCLEILDKVDNPNIQLSIRYSTSPQPIEFLIFKNRNKEIIGSVNSEFEKMIKIKDDKKIISLYDYFTSF